MMMKHRNIWAMILKNAADMGGGGGDAASVLFPNEGQPPAGDAAPPVDNPPAAGDWQEYQADPAKSDEENAAAKAEHDKTKPADPLDTVPEDGKYTFELPEGMEADEELSAAVGGVFKDLGLTVKQAQGIAAKYAEVLQARGEAKAGEYAELVGKWGEQAEKDPEIGGTRWADTAKVAGDFGTKFISEAGRQYLKETGIGNHPELIRMARNAGHHIADLEAKVAELTQQLTGEDKPATGGASGSKPAEAAYILFPNDKPKG